MPDPTRGHGNSYECLLSAISSHRDCLRDASRERLLSGKRTFKCTYEMGKLRNQCVNDLHEAVE